MMEFRGIYRDEFGEEEVSILIDESGRLLKMLLRGVEFTGFSFDTFSPKIEVDQHSPFPLSKTNELQSFELLCYLSIVVVVGGESSDNSLKVQSIVCSQEEEWEEDSFLQFTLMLKKTLFQTDWCKSGFEDELANLAEKLPEYAYLKCCSNCRFSSYNPYINSGLMGELTCFVNTEDQFSFRGKGFPGWGKDKGSLVQELFVCSEFQPSKNILDKT